MNDSNINHNWNSWRLWMWTKQQHPHPQTDSFSGCSKYFDILWSAKWKAEDWCKCFAHVTQWYCFGSTCMTQLHDCCFVYRHSFTFVECHTITLLVYVGAWNATEPTNKFVCFPRNIKSEISNGTTKRCNWKASWDSGNVHHNSRSNWNAHANPRSIEAYGFLFAGELNTFHLEFHFCVWLEESASICMCE